MASRLEPVAFHLWRAVGLVRLGGRGLCFRPSLRVCMCVCVCVQSGRHKYAAAETTPDMQGTPPQKKRAGSALFTTGLPHVLAS